MVSGDGSFGKVGAAKNSVFLSEAKLRAHEGFGGCGPETHDHVRLENIQFRLDPWAAGVDFTLAGSAVNATLAPFLEREMLHGVGDVDLRAIKSNFLQRPIQDFPCGADEGTAGQIFRVAGLFADQNDPGGGRAFAEDRLGGAGVQIAALTVLHGAAHVF